MITKEQIKSWIENTDAIPETNEEFIQLCKLALRGLAAEKLEKALSKQCEVTQSDRFTLSLLKYFPKEFDSREDLIKNIFDANLIIDEAIKKFPQHNFEAEALEEYRKEIES